MSSNSGIKDPTQRVLVYGLLVAGSIVFCWPLLWMAFSSVKAGNELFARRQHFLPETPAPSLVSPFVDHNSFKDLEGKRQSEMLAWLATFSADNPQSRGRSRASRIICAWFCDCAPVSDEFMSRFFDHV